MGPMMFPFLTGMVPPLVKEKLGEEVRRPQLISDPPPAMDVAGNQPLSPEAEAEAQRIFGTLQQRQMGPLSGLGQYINQELEQQNQGEVDEFIGEVGDMANQRFGVDLGSAGQRPMFRTWDQGGPVAMQMGGDPMMAPPMPMPPPEAPPMPMEAAAPQEQLDPNVVQQALSQAAGGIASLDEAQNYEDAFFQFTILSHMLML